MRKLIVQTFMTLDGVMQAPGGPGEDDDGGFTHGGWSMTYWDDKMGEVMGEATSRPFAMVLGRKSYDILSSYWPTAPEEAGGRCSTTPRSTLRRGVARPWSGATRC